MPNPTNGLLRARLLADVGGTNARFALTGRHVFMSRRAADALRPATRRALDRCGFEVVAVALDEIEKAGGSLRCCVGEIF